MARLRALQLCAAAASVSASLPAPVRTVVLLGDSLINRPFSEFNLSSRIAALVQPPADGGALAYVNSGNNGEEIASIAARTPAVLAQYKPWAVILFWDSDCSNVAEARLPPAAVAALRANYTRNLRAALAAVRAAGALAAVAGPEILGEGPLGLPARYANKTPMLDAYRALTRAVASDLALPYIDMRAAFLSAIPFWWLLPSGAVTVDGEHPNDTGTGIEAQLFATQINAWLQPGAEALALAPPQPSPRTILPAPQLLFAPCNASDPAQQWVATAGTVRPAGDSSACVTYAGASYDAPLEVHACAAGGAAAQAWAYDAANSALVNPAGACAGTGGACLQWSGQERGACTANPPALGAGCMIGVWPAATPTSWNNALSMSAGLLEAMHGSAAGPSPSGLCVAAVAPPPPAKPTPIILSWASRRVGCLYDFDLSVFSSTPQGCSCSAAPPPADAWAPTALDADSWLDAGMSAGCQRHILVAKHVCGFCSWNSTSVVGYNFSTAYSSTPVDAVAAFTAAAHKRGVPVGMYYSLTNNARTNTCAGTILPNPAPGQISVTTDEYNALVIAHLTELWGNYGPLEETWFDGGYTPELKILVRDLLARLQPQAVGFNGGGMVANPTRWIGTESGYAPDPTWSTCDFNSSGAGDPSSPDWYPAEVDFTTLDGDTWFYQPGVPVRSPGVLRAMYERSVGHNAVALIGIGIPPNGSMAGTEQAAALAKLGAYVSGCYGAAVVSAADQPAAVITLMPSAPSLIDRVVVDEDQTQGQLIRGWAVALLLTNGTEVQVDAGMSIGNRHITVLDTPLDVVQATLNITATVAPTRIAYFGLYAGCGDLARDLDAAAAKR